MAFSRRGTAFKKKLTEWNHGDFIGATEKFGKAVKTPRATVASWVSGRAKPNEDRIEAVAKALQLSPSEAMSLFEHARMVRDHGMTYDDDILMRILHRLEVLEQCVANIEATRRALPGTKGPKA
jgi:transcriptional regulator with XRE-family HTH domain